MFWTFILIVALALTFVRLGAYSVLVSVLSGSLQLALLVIAGLTIVIIWRRVFGKRSSDSKALISMILITSNKVMLMCCLLQ